MNRQSFPTAIHRHDQVDVWVDNLSHEFLAKSLSEIQLPADEQKKGDLFKFVVDRNRYCRAHSYLRWVLAGYLNLSPKDIQFETTSEGKPFISAGQNTVELTFNLSHSADYVAIAVGKQYALGVDIEAINHGISVLALSEEIFSTAERQQFLQLPASQKVTGFYRGWTRKEAYIKALGLGLVKSLKSFDVDIYGQQQPLLLADREASLAAQGWKLWALDHVESRGFATALATACSVEHIRCVSLA